MEHSHNINVDDNSITVTNLSKPSFILCILSMIIGYSMIFIPNVIYYWYKYYSIKNIKYIKYEYNDYIDIQIPDRRYNIGYRIEQRPIKKYGKTNIDEYIGIITEYTNQYKKYAIYVTIPFIVICFIILIGLIGLI